MYRRAVAGDELSSDFDKSDADEGIDFHEAQRLSVEHFETTYPEFIAYLNRMVREAIIRGEWECSMTTKGNSRDSDWPDRQPSGRDASIYLRKIGFDVGSVAITNVSFNWRRRDGGKYP